MHVDAVNSALRDDQNLLGMMPAYAIATHVVVPQPTCGTCATARLRASAWAECAALQLSWPHNTADVREMELLSIIWN